jgi:hypothetical protein
MRVRVRQLTSIVRCTILKLIEGGIVAKFDHGSAYQEPLAKHRRQA